MVNLLKLRYIKMIINIKINIFEKYLCNISSFVKWQTFQFLLVANLLAYAWEWNHFCRLLVVVTAWKVPNAEFFLDRISPYLGWIRRFTHYLWRINFKACVCYFSLFLKEQCFSWFFQTKYFEKKLNFQLFYLPTISRTFILSWATTRCPPS